MRIALFGATGYIGRSLLAEGLARGVDVQAFTRDVARATKVLEGYGIKGALLRSYDQLGDESYDVIVNATGIGSPAVYQKDPRRVFEVTESVDEMMLSYLQAHPDTRVVNLSTGVVYGRNSGAPIESDTLATFDPSDIREGDYYAFAKLHAEAKHRAFPEYAIVDLRVFAFFSRYVDMEDSFFMSQVAKSLKTGEVFVTSPEDMVRDYCSARDIFDVVEFLVRRESMNLACDMQSAAPVGKFELLDHLRDEFGLRYEVSEDTRFDSTTGNKRAYYSKNKELSKLGLQSTTTALGNIEHELREFPGVR
jgi:nucleoside-diphosphate-sugar epimerase